MGFDQELIHQFARRAKASKALQHDVTALSNTIQTEVKRLADGQPIADLISSNPYIAAGIAMGAGVLASRLIIGSPVAVVNSAPQRVVIDLNHNGVTHTAAPQAQAPQKPPFSIIDFVQKAIAGYETVQATLRGFQAQAAAQQQSQQAPQRDVEVEVDPEPFVNSAPI